MSFPLAQHRRGSPSDDKATVLESTRLCARSPPVATEFPNVELGKICGGYRRHASCSLPGQHRLLVTRYVSAINSPMKPPSWPGRWLLPSASLGECGAFLYEPIHGSAPDIAGGGTPPQRHHSQHGFDAAAHLCTWKNHAARTNRPRRAISACKRTGDWAVHSSPQMRTKSSPACSKRNHYRFDYC
jgi:hypothetical protein